MSAATIKKLIGKKKIEIKQNYAQYWYGDAEMVPEKVCFNPVGSQNCMGIDRAGLGRKQSCRSLLVCVLPI